MKLCSLVASPVVRILEILLSIPEYGFSALITPSWGPPAPTAHEANARSPAAVHGSHIAIMHLSRVWRAQTGVRILLHAKYASSGFGVVLLSLLDSPVSVT